MKIESFSKIVIFYIFKISTVSKFSCFGKLGDLSGEESDSFPILNGHMYFHEYYSGLKWMQSRNVICRTMYLGGL